MTAVRNGVSAGSLPGARWRKGSRSGAVGNCVEVSPVGEGLTAIRDSKAPTGAALVFAGPVLASFARAARFGLLREPTTETYLRTLVSRGFDFLHPRDASGEIAAVVGIRVHDDVIDVVRLRAQDDVVATRMPGDTIDVLRPGVVLWQRAGRDIEVLAALLALPDDRTPGALDLHRADSAARGCWVPVAPGRAKWLSVTA